MATGRQLALGTGIRLQRRIGVVGIAGVVLLVLAAAGLLMVPTLREDAQALWSEIARGTGERPVPRTRTADPAQRVARFASQLPPWRHHADDLAAIFEIARQTRVDLPQGDYAVKSEAGSPFITYTITLPVHEPYRSLKGFVGELLQRLPNASLDELRMTRQDSLTSELETLVRITLYYRATPEAQP